MALCKQSSIYRHDILHKCLLGQDKVSHTDMVVLTPLVSELCPLLIV